MNTIEKIYTNYDGLLEEFSEEVIQSRYAVFYEEIEEFAKSLGIREKIQISESLLSHAVLDYFTDISRLKHFHQAKHINSLKVISYETYWLLRRKPIQILVEDETSDAMAFLNEKFVFSRIAKYLMGDGKRVILSPETKKGFLNYLDSLFYYLKYRNYDAEMLDKLCDFQVAWAEILTPLGNTVCLINTKHRNFHRLHRAQKFRCQKAFRGDINNLVPALHGKAECLPVLRRT